jgi:AAA15 family ATPase/GTPase
MTSITRLRVRNYKSIEDLEFEPGQINLITGRNNTGKTSLLEAIDLSFNPRQLVEFSENIDGLINVHSDFCSVDIEFRRTQQAQLDDFEDADPEINHQEFVLRHPQNKRAINIFTKSLQDILQLNEDYPLRIQRRLERRGIEQRGIFDTKLDQANLGELIQDTLQDTINKLSKELLLPEVQQNSIIVQVNNKEYELIHMSDFYKEIRRHIISESLPKIKKEVLEESINDISQETMDTIDRSLTSSLDHQLAPRFGSVRFVEEGPQNIRGVKFVKSPTLVPDDVDMAKDKSAIKLDNVEKYIIENDIVEDLSDLSFNKLVFEDDSEKYEIPYSFMGDGFQTLVGILWEIFSDERENQVLLLEEPDVHMHPGYIEEIIMQLVEICKEKDIQLFMTSHNRDVINSFFSERMSNKNGKYLEQNFKLLQLTEPVPRSLSYLNAEEEVNELDIDLRGI